MRGFVVEADGDLKFLEEPLVEGKWYSLQQLQQAVDGYIEVVGSVVIEGEEHTLLGNEMTALDDTSVTNASASIMFGKMLFGAIAAIPKSMLR
jgi:hypothetical protein